MGILVCPGDFPFAEPFKCADGIVGGAFYDGRRKSISWSSKAPSPPGPPATPTNLATIIGDTEVDLDWDGNSECDFSHYNVNRSTTPGGPYGQVATDLTGTTYLDTGLTNGTTYYYVVTAVDLDLNESGNSNEASATPVAMYPVTIDNYSFEQPSGGKQNGVVPDYWSAEGSDYGIEGYGYDGSQCAFPLPKMTWNKVAYLLENGIFVFSKPHELLLII